MQANTSPVMIIMSIYQDEEMHNLKPPGVHPVECPQAWCWCCGLTIKLYVVQCSNNKLSVPTNSTLFST